MAETLVASTAIDDGVGSAPLGPTLHSPSGEVEGENESDMTSPPTLEPAALHRKPVTKMIKEQEIDEFLETTQLYHDERLLDRPW